MASGVMAVVFAIPLGIIITGSAYSRRNMDRPQPIYLDYNATTPIAKEVADAMVPYLYGFFGNPSSSHPYGIQAKLAIENARKQVAQAIQCQTQEVLFTSGGTESNNLALRGYALSHRHKGNHIITSAIEHPAVLEVCRYLEGQGFTITYLPVDQYGWVDPKQLENALSPQTLIVSIMHANNEVGTIQPIAALADLTHQAGALFHTDAAQSVGKLPVDVDNLDIDLLSMAGHKFYAPKGIGALYIRNGVRLEQITFGASQEKNLRPGTENVLEIVGLGAAAQEAYQNLAKRIRHLQSLRDRLHAGLEAVLPPGMLHLNGHPDERLPNTLNLSFQGIKANQFLNQIQGSIAASAGAACHTDRVEVSSVLTAMEVPLEWAQGAVRFSVGEMTTQEEIDHAIISIAQTLKK
jgi:cysteine desulfurase NifS